MQPLFLGIIMLTVEILRQIEFVVDMCVIAVVILHIKNWKGLTSALISSFVFFLVQSISLLSTPYIVDVIAKENKTFAIYLFYFGYAAVDLVAVWLIYKLHLIASKPISRYSNFVARLLQMLAVTQVIRIFDRQMGVDFLGGVYQHFIPACNIAIVCILLLELLKTSRNQPINGGV